MAKPVGRGKGKGGPVGGRGRAIVMVLVGFVVLAIGVNLRRVYGFGQQREIGEMTRRRDALVSEQLKLQEAIRTASDRQHITDVAQSRLNMRLPDLDQVINLPRRPLPPRPDSVRP